MTNELTIPLLPCRGIDEVASFHEMLGFSQTHRQTRPNPHLAVRREDINLHFYGMGGHIPEQSHSTCLVIVEDTGPLFAAGMRTVRGKLLVSGIPRMTRPRLRNDRHTGFTVVDPGGDWIRINRAAREPGARTALRRTDGSAPEPQDARACRDESVERIGSRPGAGTPAGGEGFPE